VFREDDGDISLGFDGFGWHTHADLLASLFETDEQEAIARFVDNLVNDRSVIVQHFVNGIVSDTWITDDPVSEGTDLIDGEQYHLRFWSGRPFNTRHR
jgi:hypothetical protein